VEPRTKSCVADHQWSATVVASDSMSVRQGVHAFPSQGKGRMRLGTTSHQKQWGTALVADPAPSAYASNGDDTSPRVPTIIRRSGSDLPDAFSAS
jgi:hypothetical protein